MTIAITSRWRWTVAFAALCVAIAGGTTALAQMPSSPPSTVFGSVTDAAGVVPEGLPVEGYIGDKLCGNDGKTQFTGEGDARVTVYWVNIVADEQTSGCGKTGKDMRIKIGDRFAEQTGKWNVGAVRVDVTFGDVTPAPIPTRTPAPRNTTAGGSSTVETNAEGTPIAQASGSVVALGTIPAGSPGAGSPYPTRAGGLTTANGAAGGGTGGGGGFPLWGVAILVLGGIAAVGGGVGYAMSRSNHDDDLELPDDDLPYPPDA